MVSVVLAPRAVSSGSEADAPAMAGDPPVDAGDYGGGGEAARYRLAVQAAEHGWSTSA